MKNWSDYFNVVGLLTQAGPAYDGGDTPSHEGLARLADYLNLRGTFPSPITYSQFAKLLVTSNNLLIRNPINYSDPSGTTRDQYCGFIVCASFFDFSSLRTDMYKALPRNFLGYPHYPSGDLFTPVDYVMFDRLHKSYLSRLIADLWQLGSTLVLLGWATRSPGFIARLLGKLWWGFTNMEPPNAQGVPQSPRGASYTSDDLGTIRLLLQGACQKPTFVNKLTRKIYGKFRPNGVQWALSSYFGGPDDPPVDLLFANIIPKYF